MKSTLKVTLAVLASNALLLLAPAGASAASPVLPTQTVNDAGGLLTDAEEATLTQVFQQQYETNELNIGLATTTTTTLKGRWNAWRQHGLPRTSSGTTTSSLPHPRTHVPRCM